MDPLTLFALANGAVSAVKAGCKLYKDIKSASGDIKDVLKDLDNQFHKLYPSGSTTAQRNAYIAEKNRVIDLNKKGGDTTSIYTEIGEHLGTYYDNLHKCMAVFEDEERRAKTEIYKGDDSVGKRALKRVLMRKQLEQMGVELRELMVYQSPPELGALYTEVNEMMLVVGKEQKILITKQIQQQVAQDRRRDARRKQAIDEAIIGIGIVIIIVFYGFAMMYVAQLRQEMYPQYGNEFIPKTDDQRREESQPKVYVGR